MYRKSNHYVVYQELLITINITITKNNIITINNNSTIVLKVNYTSKMKKQAQEKEIKFVATRDEGGASCRRGKQMKAVRDCVTASHSVVSDSL